MPRAFVMSSEGFSTPKFIPSIALVYRWLLKINISRKIERKQKALLATKLQPHCLAAGFQAHQSKTELNGLFSDSALDFNCSH